MKTKSIPEVIMLFAGLVASIIMYIMHYELQTFLLILLFVLVCFFLLGCLLKTAIERFEAKNQKAEEERILMEALEAQQSLITDIEMDANMDGSVIEK